MHFQDRLELRVDQKVLLRHGSREVRQGYGWLLADATQRVDGAGCSKLFLGAEEQFDVLDFVFRALDARGGLVRAGLSLLVAARHVAGTALPPVRAHARSPEGREVDCSSFFTEEDRLKTYKALRIQAESYLLAPNRLEVYLQVV